MFVFHFLVVRFRRFRRRRQNDQTPKRPELSFERGPIFLTDLANEEFHFLCRGIPRSSAFAQNLAANEPCPALSVLTQ